MSREREEEEEYLRRKEYEKRKIQEENEEELNYHMKIKARHLSSEKNDDYIDDRNRFEKEKEREQDRYRERDKEGYNSMGDRVMLNTENLDIHLSRNQEDGGEGYIKCAVNGYLYLNIKNIEFFKPKI